VAKTGRGHVSESSAWLLALYRRPDGSEWGGQVLEDATSGAVTRSYVSNLKNGRIGNPGLAKLEGIAGAMGFPTRLWFGRESDDPAPDAALSAAMEDGTARGIPPRGRVDGRPEPQIPGAAGDPPPKHSGLQGATASAIVVSL